MSAQQVKDTDSRFTKQYNNITALETTKPNIHASASRISLPRNSPGLSLYAKTERGGEFSRHSYQKWVEKKLTISD